jgi:hypothetical protein
MSKPIVNSVVFPTLHTTPNVASDGTVTGTDVGHKNKVKIHEKNASTPLKWEGDVTNLVSTDPQGNETWNAQVFIKGSAQPKGKGPGPEVLETVTVTVNNGQDSDPADTDSNVVP